MEKVRIGLVGCGLFGESHLQAYRSVRTAEIAAAYDTDRDRAERMAREFNISSVCNSLVEICSRPGLDAIDVVTPEHLHADAVTCALAHHKHAFVEKPLALDLQQCRDMITSAASAKRILMVGQLLRFETRYAMLKDKITAGCLGNIVSMHARRNRPKTLLPRYGRTHPALENCVHDIDLMLWYTKSKVKRVRGYGRSATGGVNPDTFWGMIEFENGAIGVVETIWLIPPSAGVMLDDALEVIGDMGVANIRLVPGSLDLWLEGGPEMPDVSYDPRVSASARGALREELAYFCDCVLDGRQPQVIRAEEAMAAVEVALALVDSARSDKEVEIAGAGGRNG